MHEQSVQCADEYAGGELPQCLVCEYVGGELPQCLVCEYVGGELPQCLVCALTLGTCLGGHWRGDKRQRR